MTRRCSHCGHNGHNSRTCPNRGGGGGGGGGVRIFGVRFTDGSAIRKSASMGNLSHYSGSGSPADGTDHGGAAADGYASEDFVAGSSSSRERKKGVPWTEDEHRMFLIGLQKLGKGDWRGIARNYVVSRTPTQVASHAQKYFIRQTNLTRRKRRSSLFDMVSDEAVDGQAFSVSCQEQDKHENDPLPAPPAVDKECDSMDSNLHGGEEAAPNSGPLPCTYPLMVPSFFPPIFPFPWPYWPGYRAGPVEDKAHEIVKPTPVHSKPPTNVNDLAGMSKLSLGESNGEPSLSLSLTLGGSNRQSAFHANASTNGSSLNSSTNPIHAV